MLINGIDIDREEPTPSPAPASGAETPKPTCECKGVRSFFNLLCDECGLPAAKGTTEFRESSRLPGSCGHAILHIPAVPTPPSDAGTSERETCPDCPHAPHLGTPCAECRRFGGFRGECSHQGAKGRPAAPAAEGPRAEPWTCHRVREYGGTCSTTNEGETCDACGADRPALPGAEAGTPEGESGTAERTRWMVETEAGRADTIERCKYASDGPSHLITAFARHCTALTSEVARLTEERDAARDAMVRYSDYYDREVEHNTALIAERRALTSEVRALREDKARLDWMQEHAAEAFPVFDMDPEAEIGYRVKSEETLDAGEGAQLRDAIDAARLASPSPTGAP